MLDGERSNDGRESDTDGPLTAPRAVEFAGGEDDGERIALEHTNGWAAYDTLERFLIDDGWFPQQIEGTTAFRCGFQGQSAKFRVIAHLNVEMQQAYLYVVGEVYVPEESRAAVAEFVCRANYGMRIGNLELDVNDGEVRFKSSLDFEGVALNDALIRNAIYPAVTSMDRYFPGVLRVAFGDGDPFEAIAEIEGYVIEPDEDDGLGGFD